MKKKTADKIRQIFPMAILVILVVVIILLRAGLNENKSSVINNITPENNEGTIDDVNLIDSFMIVPNDEELAEEAVEAILTTQKIKQQSPSLEDKNPFHDSKKRTSPLDVFNFFGQYSKAAQNENLFVETIASDNAITTQINRVIDGEMSSDDYFSMTLKLNNSSAINTYSQGDYVLHESDQSLMAQYQLVDKKLKESIIIDKHTPGTSLIFDLDYPSSHNLEPTGNGGIIMTKLVDGREQAVWQILPATVTDRKGKSSEVTLDLINNQQIRYTFDENFLDSADYPIVFDPTVEIPDARFLHQIVWDDSHNQAILFGGVQLLETYGYPSNTYGVADTWIYRVGDVPEYASDHIYDFTICLSQSTQLNFAVNDIVTYDNSGSYTVNTCTNSSCGTPETLTVDFTNGTTPTTTTNSYSGCFNIEVTGFGEAAGTQYSDAFYRFTDSAHNELADPVHYKLGYGDNNFALIINGASPAYLIPGHEGRWMKKYPATSPGARGMFSMTWDSQNDQVILYGGANYTDNTFYSDTWVYIPPASENEEGEWIRKNPTGNPGKLARTQMTFDKSNNQAILHSGLLHTYGLNGTTTGETWAYDPDANGGQGVWSLLTDTGPSVYLHTIDWDEQNNQVILFGGDEC